MSDASHKDRDVLEELYLGRGLTTREVADRLDVTHSTISRWLDRHDIPTRDNWRAGVEAAREANRKEKVALQTLPSGYEYWTTKEWEDGSRVGRIVYVHRLLAVAEYGFEAVADMDIHHENGVPWDNRPENVVPMEKAEHTRLHNTNGGVPA